MAKTIPIIISNNCVLVRDHETMEFKPFTVPTVEVPNVPFYHQFAEKIAETQVSFKEFVKKLYGKKTSKSILAIIVPDDTTALESIFINEFFLNSGACKAVAQTTMGQALSAGNTRYISVSKSSRCVVLQYICDGEVLAKRYYDSDTKDINAIKEDAKRLHIDVEYSGVPIFINNFNLNMDDFESLGEMVSPKDFLDKIANIDVEKV